MRILKLYYFVGHKICSKVLILFPFYEPYPDSFLHCGNVFLFNMFCFLPFLSIGKLKRMLHYSDLLSFCLAETFFVQHVKTQRKIRLDFPGKFFEFSLLGPPLFFCPKNCFFFEFSEKMSNFFLNEIDCKNVFQ